MGFFSKLANSLVEKYGIVIEGDYISAPVSCDTKRIIFQGDKNFAFTKQDIVSYNPIRSTVKSEVSKKTGRVENVTYTIVEIDFKNGKRSVIEINSVGFEFVKKIL